MTTEKLMQPRYKVMADYPGSTWEIGVVFDTRTPSYFNKYHANFRCLEWWEDRKIQEMPKYVKKEGDVFQLQYRLFNGIQIDYSVVEGGRINAWFPVEEFKDVFPATEEEYNTYISTSKQ